MGALLDAGPTLIGCIRPSLAAIFGSDLLLAGRGEATRKKTPITSISRY